MIARFKAKSAALAAILVMCGCASSTSQSAPALPAPPEIRNGEELVQAMYDRYAGKWYKTLTFVQNTATTQPDGAARNETWYEAASLPGRLRIDIEPLSAGKGILFSNDTIYNLDKGAVTRSGPFVHPLLVLGFDVYAQPASRSIAQLRQVGFDLSKLHTDTWEGRPAYVVGAAAGDLHTKQFWVDRDRLLFVRLLQPMRDTTKTAETRFNKYERAGKTWISPEVEFISDGKRMTLESYSQIKTDVPLDPALFDPRQWSTAKHWFGK